MGPKVKVSVVILTRNEASRIKECIDSVRWADEVLVVDDGSEDGTPQIAVSLGARVIRRRMDVEGRHRNWASEQAKNEWILSLDADERVSPELADEISDVIGDASSYELYAIPRRNYIGKRWIRHGGWYPSPQLKLFKRSIFKWEEASVHPRGISDRPCGRLVHDIIHYSYRDISDFIEKMNRQTTLEAQKWLVSGRGVSLGKATWRMFDRFWRSFIWKKGYLDGYLGFIVATFASAYQLLSYMKYVEARSSADTIPPKAV